MDCREALEHFDDHIAGQLGTLARWRLRLHLWVCRHCRRYLRSYQTTLRAEQAAFDDPADPPAEPMSDADVASILSAVQDAATRGESSGREP